MRAHQDTWLLLPGANHPGLPGNVQEFVDCQRVCPPRVLAWSGMARQPSDPPDTMVRRRPRVRIEVSEPTCVDGRWCCTGKLVGDKYDHLPWLGSGERPEDLDDDVPTATLLLVSGVGDTAEEARRRVMNKIRNVWGTDTTPPPGPAITEVDTIRGHGAPEEKGTFVSRLTRLFKRRAG